jgi:uncharacterized flavoprotein (TIGR03862 family)
LRDWAQALGVSTFVGTSGRVFPTDLKAAPLLRAWLHRLREQGVSFHMRHRWLGWDGDAAQGQLRFQTKDGETTQHFDAVVLALGGGSWSRLGSDGAWVPLLQSQGVDIAPLRSANCGFDVAPTGPDRAGWSDHLIQRFAGLPIKPVALQFTDQRGHTHRQQGEFVMTDTGVEGSLIYAFSARIRDQIASSSGHATVVPGPAALAHARAGAGRDLARPRAAQPVDPPQKPLGLQGLKMALLHEVLSPASN